MKIVRKEILKQALLDERWYKDKIEFSENDFDYILDKLGDTWYIIDGNTECMDYIKYDKHAKEFIKIKENDYLGN